MLTQQLTQQYDDLSNSTSDLLDKVRDLSAKNKELVKPTELGKPTLENFNRVVTNLGDYVYSLSYLDTLASGRLTKEDVTILLKNIETNMSTFREQINNAKNQLKESLSEEDLSMLKKQFSEAKILYNTLGDARSQVKELLLTEPKEIPPKKETETKEYVPKEHVPTIIDDIVKVLEHTPKSKSELFFNWREEHKKYKGDINQKALSDVLQDDVLRASVADALGIEGGEAALKKLLTIPVQEETITEPKQEETITESKPGSFVITDGGPGIITSILGDKVNIVNLKGESSLIDISKAELISPDALSKANNTKLNNMYQTWLKRPGKNIAPKPVTELKPTETYGFVPQSLEDMIYSYFLANDPEVISNIRDPKVDVKATLSKRAWEEPDIRDAIATIMGITGDQLLDIMKAVFGDKGPSEKSYGKKASKIPIKLVGMSIPLNFNTQQVSIPISIL